MRYRHRKNSRKKFKNFSKIHKCPKLFPKASKGALGRFFEKKMPSVPWRVESSKNFEVKKFSKLQKCPKLFAKVTKCVLNMFWVNYFEKSFCPVFHGGSSLRKFSKKSKNFQISKNGQNRSRKCPNVF